MSVSFIDYTQLIFFLQYIILKTLCKYNVNHVFNIILEYYCDL